MFIDIFQEYICNIIIININWILILFDFENDLLEYFDNKEWHEFIIKYGMRKILI